MALQMDAAALNAFLAREFPQLEGALTVLDANEAGLTARLHVTEANLRPGGTVSGPSMFALADVTAYVATMAPVGREALAVTTSCSMDFMRKPEGGVDLIAKGRLLKLGRALTVTDVLIYSEGADKPVARASMTYSIPPNPGRA